MYSSEFHNFERFIEKINSKLQKLSVITHLEDMTYLDAYQWKQLIVKSFAQLAKFSFKYNEYIDKHTVFPICPYKSNIFFIVVD